ncbi:hypothetical protein UPYG_G00010960 [Umbra pygmaea]|uniref:Transmembrane protein 51 n=1 Tax=Umbra pygmaea TaxID=75934 RepID=A0ABD0XIJ5_UMBPY
MSPNPSVSSHNNSPGNSGSQYALCALGVGLVALGIVMIVWSVVPSEVAGSNSGGNSKPDNRGRASSIAFFLVGAGVSMLLLSLCLGMRNRQREQQALLQGPILGADNVSAREEEAETAEERAQRYNVPTYEEAVGSGQYPISQSNLRHSSSQLPTYDDLVDSVQIRMEGCASANTAFSAAAAAPANSQAGCLGLKLLPVNIRRIQSEKLFMKDTGTCQPPEGISIEPLTPPPMYEDKVPQL